MKSSRMILAALLVGTALLMSGANAQEAEPKADPFLSYDFEALLKQYDDSVAAVPNPFNDMPFPFYLILDSLSFVPSSAALDTQVDVNWSQEVGSGVVTIKGNTIPDLFEFGVLRAVLASQDQYNFGVALPAGLAADREAIRSAFTSNYQQLVTDGGPALVKLGNERRDLAYILAAYAMIGNGGVKTITTNTYSGTQALGFLYSLYDYSLGRPLSLNPANLYRQYFASGGDADGDGFINYLEFIAYGKQGPYAYVRYALTPDTDFYTVNLTSSSPGGQASFSFPAGWQGNKFLPGTELKLTAQALAGWRFDSWRLNNAPYNSSTDTITVLLDDEQYEKNFVATFKENAILTVQAPDGTGVSTPAAGTYTYAKGQEVILTATPNANWRFSKWEVNGQTRTENPLRYVLREANTTIKPFFVQSVNYTLTVAGPLSLTDSQLDPLPAETVPAPGETVPPKGQYSYSNGLEALIVAKPFTNWDFSHWIVDNGSTVTYPETAELRLTISGNSKVQPVFSQNFNLQILADGEGTITPSPGTYTYAAGESLSITATASGKSRFDHWEIAGAADSTANPLTVLMNANKTVKGVFKPVYTVQAQVSPPGSGQVVLNPASGPYVEGAQVTINATPTQSYGLDHWAIRFTESTTEVPLELPASNPLVLTIDSNKYVTAVFKKAVRLTMFMNATSQTYGDTEPPTGSSLRTVGSTVTLVASPKPGGEFVDWIITGIADPITTPLYELQIGEAPITVKATFRARPKYTITVTSTPAEGGVISTDPDSLTGGLFEFYTGTNVLLTASPHILLNDNPRYRFLGWTGDVPAVSSASVTVGMNSNKVAEAHYQRVYALTTGINGEGQIRVTPEPGVEGFYDAGTDVVLTASNDRTRWRLDKWVVNGVDSGTDSTLILKMDRDTNAIAVFKEIPVYTLSIVLDPPSGGDVLPSNGRSEYVQQLAENSTLSLVAAPKDDYEFIGWDGDGAVTADKSLNVTMNANKTIVAKFARLYKLTIVSGSIGGVVSAYPEPSLQTSYASGLDVLLRARPDTGYRFDRWSRPLHDQGNPALVTMDSDVQITPYFKRVYKLTGSVTGSGTVEMNWGANTLLLPEAAAKDAAVVVLPMAEEGKVPVTISVQPSKSAIKWSLDSGITWQKSGDTKNMEPGRYTVVFQGVDGWQTPADLALTVAATDTAVTRTVSTNRVHDDGSYVELVAKPAAGNHLVGFRWPDGSVTTDIVTSIQMNADKSFECVFAVGDAPTTEGEGAVEGDAVEGDKPAASGCAGGVVLPPSGGGRGGDAMLLAGVACALMLLGRKAQSVRA